MNWFKYRLPGETKAFSGSSSRLINGLESGFAMAPFISPAVGIVTIPADRLLEENPTVTAINSDIPFSTNRDEYIAEVEAIISDLDGGCGKTVAARVMTECRAIELSASFESLCRRYPEAFVFMFSTQEYGTWIGASPELLLKKNCERLSTMALAGTRPVDTVGEWDNKNIEEQRLVADFIHKELKNACANVSKEDTFTKKAGPVEHICTPFSATADANFNASSLLSSLSPTPALCGSDRERSLVLISRLEHFEREIYGGYCGPVDPNGDFALYVCIRCAKCTPDATALFVGGGITSESCAEDEWIETETKALTLKNALIFKDYTDIT